MSDLRTDGLLCSELCRFLELVLCRTVGLCWRLSWGRGLIADVWWLYGREVGRELELLLPVCSAAPADGDRNRHGNIHEYNYTQSERVSE